jgi:ElaB/YqjD/DUF883 family membrane-anchored ribosome-binding protein
MDKTGLKGQARDKLIGELQLVIRDAEDLLRNSGQQMDERYQAARARFESTLGSARDELATLEERVMAGTREALDSADHYVQQNPWQAVGAGALAGLLIGLVLGRR